jgi:alkanesulfonate monooxygenase SsuD/methylene tetrahydromethanopterin reductase-like flavin-dependent oxidoreductase (luciferase family)
MDLRTGMSFPAGGAARLRAVPDADPASCSAFVDAVLALWSGRRDFQGRWVSFTGVLQAPPVQPTPPLVVGGHSRAALRRAARLADGWFGWELDVAATAAAVASLEGEARRLGRAGRLEISITAPEEQLTPELVAAYARVGVDRLVLQPASFTGTEIDDLIEHVGQELVTFR